MTLRPEAEGLHLHVNVSARQVASDSVLDDIETVLEMTELPDGVETVGGEFFDPEKMTQLYDVGYRAALSGPVWSTDPPGLRNISPR